MSSTSIPATSSPSTRPPRVAYTIAVHGTLRFNPSVNTRLTVTNLMVMGDHGMPIDDDGRVLWKSAPRPRRSRANVTAEIVIANSAIGGGVADPEQFGTGLLNFGKVTMHGTLEDADVGARRGRAARGPHHVDAVGGGLRMEGRRPARPAGYAAHQGERSHRQRLDQRCRTSGKSGPSRPFRRTAAPSR